MYGLNEKTQGRPCVFCIKTIKTVENPNPPYQVWIERKKRKAFLAFLFIKI